ncbi:MAG: lipopolysaccharide biosynthesis protein [Bacteroidota bacterium]
MSTKGYTRNFITMLSGNTFSQVIPFLLAPFLARFITREEFADFSNFMAIVGIFGIVATGRLEMAITLPKEQTKAQKIVYSGLVISLALSVISVILFFFREQIASWYNSTTLSDFIWMIPLSVLSIGLLAINSNISLRLKKFRHLSIGKVSQSLVNNGAAVFLAYVGMGVYGLIVSWLFSQYIHVLYLYFNFYREFAFRWFGSGVIKETLVEYKDFPLVNSFHAFMDMFATQFVLFWVITSYYGKIELGLFAMMVKYVKAPIVLVSSSVSQLYFVEASNAVNEQRSLVPITLKTLKTSTFFAVPFAVILWFFAPWIFKVYLGKDWEMAGEYAKCLIPMFFLYFIASPISSTPIIFNRQKRAFVISLAGYILTLLSIILAVYLKWTFLQVLWLYGASFAIYYLVLLLWYLKLIQTTRK